MPLIWVNKPEESVLEDVLEIDTEGLSLSQEERLKSGRWIPLDAEKIKGYNCPGCGKHEEAPKVDRNVFDESVSGGETYGIVKYICNYCNYELGQAKLTEEDFYKDLAKDIHEAGGI